MKKIVLLGISSLFLLTGCNTLGGGFSVDTSYTYGAPISPPHASSYSRPRQHSYYYYPRAEFYFDSSRSMYFYLDSGSRWTHSTTLPHRLRGYLSNPYVEIQMDVDRPYLRHKYYRNKYNQSWVKPKHRNRYEKRDNRKHEYLNKTRPLEKRPHGKNEYKSKYKSKKRHGDEKYRDDDEKAPHRSKGLRDNRYKH